MTEFTCESVCIAAMASAEGYQSEASPEQIEAHLADCPDCRHELNQLRQLTSLFDEQKRQQRSEHIWTGIEGRLPEAALPQSASPAGSPFLLLCLFLLGYKLIELIPDRDSGFVFKLLPIFFVVAAFGYFKENPFKINAELRLEGGDWQDE